MTPSHRELILFGVGAYLLSLLVTPLVRRLAVLLGCVARPSSDRWGHRAIARLGGIPVAIGLLGACAWALRYDLRMLGLLLGGALMFVVGVVDDFRRISPYSKLVAQIVAGCVVVSAGIQVQVAIPWAAIPLTIAWLVLVMNAFNLMDNMDGLAAGVGLIAAGFCIWHAVEAQQWLIAALLSGLAGSLLGFLHYNLPPAKIFMGDTGSQLIGLGLGSLALLGARPHSTSLLGILAFPTCLLALPIFDTCFVTLQRVFHGRHPFQGGTDHLSHRLGILGLTTRQVVFTLYGVSAGFGGLTILLASQSFLMTLGILLLVAAGLLIVGSYLARVRVYTGHASVVLEQKMTLIETMLLHKQRIMEVGVDFVLICACYVIAFALRFEANLTADLEALILKSLPWVIAIQMISFFSCGLYRGVWRYTSVPDLANIFRAVVLGSVFSALWLLYLWRFEGYSRAVLIIDALLLFFTVGGMRVTERLFNEWIRESVQGGVHVLILGAGDTGELLLRQIKQETSEKRRVVGFLDDAAQKRGVRIHGIQVLGSREDLGSVVQEFSVQEVLIAMRRPPEDLLQQVRGYCQENGLTFKVVRTVTSESPLLPQDS